MHLLTDSSESRKECVRETLHAFFLHVKELEAKQAFLDAHILNKTGYAVKIHRERDLVVEARTLKPGVIFTEPLAIKVTEAEYIILKAIGQMPLHEALEKREGLGKPAHIKEWARARRILWNALAYVRRSQSA